MPTATAVSTAFPQEPSSEPLTEAQTHALQAIIHHITTHSIAPSYDDVGKALNIGKSAARVLFNHLRKRGMITFAPGRFRNVVVTMRGHYYAHAAQQATAKAKVAA